MSEFVPKPIPADPAQRADFFAAIDQGIAESEADQVIDWEELDRQICQKYGSPLPSDPAVRAELFARLDRSIASAQAGRLVEWDELDRRTRQKLGLPPA